MRAPYTGEGDDSLSGERGGLSSHACPDPPRHAGPGWQRTRPSHAQMPGTPLTLKRPRRAIHRKCLRRTAALLSGQRRTRTSVASRPGLDLSDAVCGPWLIFYRGLATFGLTVLIMANAAGRIPGGPINPARSTVVAMFADWLAPEQIRVFRGALRTETPLVALVWRIVEQQESRGRQVRRESIKAQRGEEHGSRPR